MKNYLCKNIICAILKTFGYDCRCSKQANTHWFVDKVDWFWDQENKKADCDR